jgi:hypothetical protein
MKIQAQERKLKIWKAEKEKEIGNQDVEERRKK